MPNDEKTVLTRAEVADVLENFFSRRMGDPVYSTTTGVLTVTLRQDDRGGERVDLRILRLGDLQADLVHHIGPLADLVREVDPQPAPSVAIHAAMDALQRIARRASLGDAHADPSEERVTPSEELILALLHGHIRTTEHPFGGKSRVIDTTPATTPGAYIGSGIQLYWRDGHAILYVQVTTAMATILRHTTYARMSPHRVSRLLRQYPGFIESHCQETICRRTFCSQSKYPAGRWQKLDVTAILAIEKHRDDANDADDLLSMHPEKSAS